MKVSGPATPEEVAPRDRESTEPQERERLLAMRLGQRGQWAREPRGRATIGRWVRAYRPGGLPGGRARKDGGERRTPSLSVEERERVKQGVARGQWKTVREWHAWLKRCL